MAIGNLIRTGGSCSYDSGGRHRHRSTFSRGPGLLPPCEHASRKSLLGSARLVSNFPKASSRGTQTRNRDTGACIETPTVFASRNC
jgi:hypothetical protein